MNGERSILTATVRPVGSEATFSLDSGPARRARTIGCAVGAFSSDGSLVGIARLAFSCFIVFALGSRTILFADEPIGKKEATEIVPIQRFLRSLYLAPQAARISGKKSDSGHTRNRETTPSQNGLAVESEDETSASRTGGPLRPINIATDCPRRGTASAAGYGVIAAVEDAKRGVADSGRQSGSGAPILAPFGYLLQPKGSSREMKSSSVHDTIGGSSLSRGGATQALAIPRNTAERWQANSDLSDAHQGGDSPARGDHVSAAVDATRTPPGLSLPLASSTKNATTTGSIAEQSDPVAENRTTADSQTLGERQSLLPEEWETVQPAGGGQPDSTAAIRLSGSPTDTSQVGGEARQLDGGVMKASLQTGPENPLILPPKIASVVFVVDISGSMRGRRFELVKNAIADAVRRMDDRQRFAVLLFNTEAMQTRGGGYHQANDANAMRLRDALAAIHPAGGTNPENALLIAIQLQPETIRVVSDGEFEEHLVHRVTSLNRSSGINSQINCLSIDGPANTLRLLASMNGPGNYLEVSR